MQKEIILASESQNRQQLLRSMGIPFRVLPSKINEDAIEAVDPIARVMKIAQAKAHAVAKSVNGLIIAADTFAVYNEREYQKPRDLDEAKKMLRELSGKDGKSVTGICIYDTDSGNEVLEYRIVRMHCNELTNEQIDKYVSSKPVLNWAAAYNPLDEVSSKFFVPVGQYIYKVEYYGLPVDVVAKEVKRLGFNVDLKRFMSR